MCKSQELPAVCATANVLYVLLFACGAILYAADGVLSQLSKSEDNTYKYSMPSVVFIAEWTKLILSVIFLSREKGSPGQAIAAVSKMPLRSWAGFAVPGALYAINNNLAMLCNQYMDSATFQVMSQMKIGTTGLLWWIVFRMSLGLRKSFAIVLLMMGSMCASWPSGVGKNVTYIEPLGIGLAAVYCTISAVAGVFTEWLYKGQAHVSVHLQNIKMYTWGVVGNYAMYLVGQNKSGLDLWGSSVNIIDNYNIYTWCLVADFACLGLLMSVIMRYFTNVHKLLMVGSSMYVSCLLTAVLLNVLPSMMYILGMLLVTFSLIMYNWDKLIQVWPYAKKSDEIELE
eukprot:gnl/MRDRNA2_/MRDRNA2_100742_c0_seq1.p1 gnl/MRDRNA2_/MRDRNA2_100742_c0~~gnl/MRDRNA2_/MRDRNA2_100742_c0_seq1.p1  ORF type:complete len:342 (-),score=36.87 gnl/MRDRNA2_/MRDRNA2_100742_c0_seq1:408-1433(-)